MITAILCISSLIVGAVMGLIITSVIATGSREDECYRCVEMTRQAMKVDHE